MIERSMSSQTDSKNDFKRKQRQDLNSTNSWRQFDSLLLKLAPPPPPVPSPISPRSPFSFQYLHRLEGTCSHLPASEFHLYGPHPASRAKQLILCDECGQPVPPCSLTRHFDTSHCSPPPSPPLPTPILTQELPPDTKPRVPPSLPLQPSYKLNNQPQANKIKQKSAKPQRTKEPPLPIKQDLLKLSAPSKRFPSFLADANQNSKSIKLDTGALKSSSKNLSFSCFYAPPFPPALTFRHLPSFPRPLVLGPPALRPRVAPTGLLLADRRTQFAHYALAQLLEPSQH